MVLLYTKYRLVRYFLEYSKEDGFNRLNIVGNIFYRESKEITDGTLYAMKAARTV